jgi:AAA domain
MIRHETDQVNNLTRALTFPLLSMEALHELPDIDWLVEDLLQESTISIMSGNGGVGKTFIALDFALHIAHGIPWQGKRVKQGSVLYIYSEGARGLHYRVKAWKKHFMKGDTDNLSFIPHHIDLLSQKKVLCDTIENMPITPYPYPLLWTAKLIIWYVFYKISNGYP